MSERTLWKNSPSQIVNFKVYLVCGLLFFILIAISVPLCLLSLGYAAWKYYDIKCRTYELTSERIITTHGIFSSTTDELELYRVKDYRLVQPFYLRSLGLSNIQLETSDRTDPVIEIPAVTNGREKLRQIRELVEQRRREAGVREVDDIGRIR